jgi:hypothetical protein
VVDAWRTFGALKTFLVDRFDEVRPTGERFTPDDQPAR